MPRQRHEIPTHLDVEDRAIYGLTVRQVMYLTVGAAGGYGLWNQWPVLPIPLRALLVAVPVLLALTFALLRPAGRPLDEWMFVAVHHLALPKRTVWAGCPRPRRLPDLCSGRHHPGSGNTQSACLPAS